MPADIFVTAQDGLRLHVREYGPRTALALPVVCLPGLARTVADFDALAPALANGPPPRRVIAIDSRGRGQSDYDSNPENYNLAVELGDVVTVLTALEIGEAVFIGSSRGGLLTMLLGVAHPTASPASCCTISGRSSSRRASRASRVTSASCRSRATSGKAPKSSAGCLMPSFQN